MSYLSYFWVFARIVVSSTYCILFFVLFFFVVCALCCQFLWIYIFGLPLRYSLSFILDIYLNFDINGLFSLLNPIHIEL
jgi:hypothetical protein